MFEPRSAWCDALWSGRRQQSVKCFFEFLRREGLWQARPSPESFWHRPRAVAARKHERDMARCKDFRDRKDLASPDGNVEDCGVELLLLGDLDGRRQLARRPDDHASESFQDSLDHH